MKPTTEIRVVIFEISNSKSNGSSFSLTMLTFSFARPLDKPQCVSLRNVLDLYFPVFHEGIEQGVPPVYICMYFRSWITKQNFRGQEIIRFYWHVQMPRRWNVAAFGWVNWKRSLTYFHLGTGRTLHVSKQATKTNQCLKTIAT